MFFLVPVTFLIDLCCNICQPSIPFDSRVLLDIPCGYTILYSFPSRGRDICNCVCFETVRNSVAAICTCLFSFLFYLFMLVVFIFKVGSHLPSWTRAYFIAQAGCILEADSCCSLPSARIIGMCHPVQRACLSKVLFVFVEQPPGSGISIHF